MTMADGIKGTRSHQSNGPYPVKGRVILLHATPTILKKWLPRILGIKE